MHTPVEIKVAAAFTRELAEDPRKRTQGIYSTITTCYTITHQEQIYLSGGENITK
jgi:hypothetical protein